MTHQDNLFTIESIQQRANNIGVALALTKNYTQKDVSIAIEEITYQISSKRARYKQELGNTQARHKKEVYTLEMQAYNRIRLLKRVARQSGYILTLPRHYTPTDIDKAASELSKLIMEV